jgi:prevent-host-death family protein
MTRVNVAEAKARLSRLIDAALQGEEVVIARRNTPLVKLTAVKPAGSRPRFGVLAGRITMSADFGKSLRDFARYMPGPRTRRRS